MLTRLPVITPDPILLLGSSCRRKQRFARKDILELGQIPGLLNALKEPARTMVYLARSNRNGRSAVRFCRLIQVRVEIELSILNVKVTDNVIESGDSSIN